MWNSSRISGKEVDLHEVCSIQPCRWVCSATIREFSGELWHGGDQLPTLFTCSCTTCFVFPKEKTIFKGRNFRTSRPSRKMLLLDYMRLWWLPFITFIQLLAVCFIFHECLFLWDQSQNIIVWPWCLVTGSSTYNRGLTVCVYWGRKCNKEFCANSWRILFHLQRRPFLSSCVFFVLFS